MTEIAVRLRRRIEADGMSAEKGARVPAVPGPDGRWSLRLAPDVHVVVEAEVVAYSERLHAGLRRREAAWDEHRYAAEILGYGNDAAVRWVQKSFDVTVKTLGRWGFDVRGLEWDEWNRRSKGAA